MPITPSVSPSPLDNGSETQEWTPLGVIIVIIIAVFYFIFQFIGLLKLGYWTWNPLEV